jgi:4'-phosphopantetheinyl transferase EntD
LESLPRSQNHLPDHFRPEEAPKRLLAGLPARAQLPAVSPEFRARLAGLFGQPGVVIEETSLGEEPEPLYAEEAALIVGCAKKRRREFAAGRLCARKALAELGITNFPLLANPDRAPIWPASVVGSITHTEGGASGYCGVAIASRRIALGLGIDAEPRLPLPAEVLPHVLDGDEKRVTQRADEPGVCARLIFSAKEATYKAIHPALGRFLDFPDVHIQLLPQQCLFVAELVGAARALAPAAGPLLGRFVIDDELLVTGVLLPAKGLPLAQEGFSRHHVPS